MARILNMLVALVAYVCVATVISAALGLAYLWHTDRLNDQKVFRIVALLHDIDLHQVTESRRRLSTDVPPEEPALEALLQRQHVQDRNFEMKLLALQRARQDFDLRLQDLKTQTDRYDRLAQEWQAKLRQQEEIATQENLAAVVAQLEHVTPEVAKELLLRWIEEGRMDDAILLMSRMSETKLSKILKTFETKPELDRLHEIHQRIIGRGSPLLEKALGELKQLELKS